MISHEDFTNDAPWVEAEPALTEFTIADQIDGVVLRRLVTHADSRGDLTVLFSQYYTPNAVVPHAYLVRAAPGSLRAWVYHKLQHDRLSCKFGQIRIVLYDLRSESPTYGKLNVLEVGEDNPTQVTIPPFVAHAVQNYGTSDAFFINLPTRAYDPTAPDKLRLPANHPGIPYSFG